MTTDSVTPIPRITYAEVDLSDIDLRFSRSRSRHPELEYVEISGLPAVPSPRFLPSLKRALRLDPSVFRLFDPREVFDRVREKRLAGRLRVAVEANPEGPGRALGVTVPATPVITPEHIDAIADRIATPITRTSYEDGVVRLWHAPLALTGAECLVAGEAHRYQCLTQVPVDGYGSPSNFLGMERMVCSNGMVAWAPAFRTTIPLGRRADESPVPAMVRFMEAYQDEAGYAALRQRLESARATPASLREAYALKKLLDHEDAQSLHRRKGTITTESSDLETAFFSMSGRIEDLYGVATLNDISPRRQALSPCKAIVSDLIHFGTEVATHRASPKIARKIHGWIGTLLCNEFDLEGAPVSPREAVPMYLTHN